MTKTTAAVGIAGRNSLSPIMPNTEEKARGKWTIVTRYPKAEQIISGILFLHALNVIEANVIVED
jgi:hypothetical protein